MPKKCSLRKRALEKLRSLCVLNMNQSEKDLAVAGNKTPCKLIKESTTKTDDKVNEEQRKIELRAVRNKARTPNKKPRGIRISRKAVQRNRYLREKFGVQKQVLGFCPRFCSIVEEHDENEDSETRARNRKKDMERFRRLDLHSRDKTEISSKGSSSSQLERDIERYGKLAHLKTVEHKSDISNEEDVYYFSRNLVDKFANTAGGSSNSTGEQFSTITKNGGENDCCVYSEREKRKEKKEMGEERENMTNNNTISYMTRSNTEGAKNDQESSDDLSESTVLGQVKDEIMAIWHRLVSIENDFDTMRTTVREIREQDPLTDVNHKM